MGWWDADFATYEGLCHRKSCVTANAIAEIMACDHTLPTRKELTYA